MNLFLHYFPTRRSSDLDLVPANKPWVVYYDYKQRYASNAVIDFLRKDAHEHRVTARLAPFTSRHLVDETTEQFTGVDRKSTRLNSSHLVISYAVFCFKK